MLQRSRRAFLKAKSIVYLNIIAWSANAPGAELRPVERAALPRRHLSLLSPDLIDQFDEQEIRRAFQRVFTVIIGALPGARTVEMKERFRMYG